MFAEFRINVITVALWAALLPSAAAWAGPQTDKADVPDGWVVFDSKRDGQFDIYKMRPDGGRVERLTRTDEWECCPDWSPDGKRIAFARREAGDDDNTGDVWIMDADGGNPALVVRNATAPQFTADGRFLVVERDRVSIYKVSILTGRQRQLTPPPGGPSFKYHMVKPRLSPDGETVAFISDRWGRWNNWAMDMKGRSRHIGRGCQPNWSPDGKTIYYIADGGRRENVIMAVDWPSGKARQHLALSGSHTHVYFPAVSNDGRWLMFAACPPDQHDHSTAHYQIFIQKLPGDAPVRLSRNDYIERWPRLWLKPR